MRPVLRGKTQEFIQGGITPSGLATQVRRGIIKGFDATTYRATVQLLGSLSVWLEGVPVAKHIGNNLLASGTRCGVLFFDESNPGDACVAFVYDGAPGPWITSGLVVDGAITAADCLSNVAGGVATIDASGDLNPPNHVRAAGRFYPGGQGTRYIYDAGATSGLASAGGPFSTTGYIFPGTGSALQTTGYLTANAAGNLALMGGHVGIGTTPAAWDSAFRGVQIGGTGAVSAHSAAAAPGHAFNIMHNAYYGGSPADFRYLAADAATRVMLTGGALYVLTAPAGAVEGVIPWTERVRITNGGHVGIGTTPSSILHIKGTSPVLTIENAVQYEDQVIWLRRTGITYLGVKLWHDDSAGHLYLDNLYDDPTGNMYLRTKASGASPINALTILGGGHVGIGTTPAAWDSAFRGLQIGGTGTISAHSAAAAAGHAFNIMQNAYYGGSPVVYRYLAADAATRVMLAAGGLYIDTAPSGGVDAAITWTGRVQVANDGHLFTFGYIYPGTGSGIQSSRYIRDDGDRLLAYGGFKIDVSSGDTPLVFQRAGGYKWVNFVYAASDDIRWSAWTGAAWADRMVLDDGSGNLYIDGTYNTFSPLPPKENMSPEDYLAWAMEDASKPLKPYSGIPKEPAELERYGKDISKIAIGVARYVDHLRTQIAALEARLTQTGF